MKSRDDSRATTAAKGRELWRTDGTAAGTVIVKDVMPGNGSSYPDQMTAMNDILYFVDADGVTGTEQSGAELWRSDGTTAGTYVVKDLVSFVLANPQSPPPVFVDNIGKLNERANGTAVLRIEYSDGQSGVLTVGCHGPAAPPGIFEGIATTKGFKTYYDVQAPAGGVDANRTIFHVR